jgi:hypothetical protein
MTRFREIYAAKSRQADLGTVWKGPYRIVWPSGRGAALGENYTVKQGDYLSKIASEHGFFDHTTIWNHPANAELKKKRQNPSVLFPGDTLFIPDKEQRAYPRPSGNNHTFVIKRERLKLRVVLEDQYEKPVAGAKCKVTIDAEDKDLTTDGKGKFELNIPLKAQSGAMVIDSKETPYDGEFFSLHIGELDPVETLSGSRRGSTTSAIFRAHRTGMTILRSCRPWKNFSASTT